MGLQPMLGLTNTKWTGRPPRQEKWKGTTGSEEYWKPCTSTNSNMHNSNLDWALTINPSWLPLLEKPACS